MTERNLATLSLRARRGLAQLVIQSEAHDAQALVAWLWQNPRAMDRMPGVANITRKEICEWLGFPYDAVMEVAEDFTGQYSATRVRNAIRLLQRFGWRFEFNERPPRALPPDLMETPVRPR